MAATPTAVSADYTALVQSIYISYFGRPADTIGLKNYSDQLAALNAPLTMKGLLESTNASIKTLVNSFGSSAESVALYGTDTIAFVKAIYVNVLNRTADFDGLAFWAGEIDAGKLTKAAAALNIAQGALVNTSAQGLIDKATLENKVVIATAFTKEVNTTEELSAYSGAAAAATARAMLLTVTNTTVAADFQATVVATLASVVTNAVPTTPAIPSMTLTLTTGVDSGAAFVGGTANDTFIGSFLATDASKNTLTSADSLNGGAGTDTLRLSTGGVGAVVAGAGVTTTSVEVIDITNASTTLSVDTSLFTGVDTIVSTGSTGATTVTALKTIPTVTINATAGSLSVATIASAVIGTADKATVNLSGSYTAADGTVTFNGIETLTVATSGSGSGNATVVAGSTTNAATATVAIVDDSLTTLAVTGDAGSVLSATLSGATGTTTGTVTSAAGADNIAITAGSSGKLSVAMGAGNDTVQLGTIVATYTVDGGDGTGDTLVYSGATAVTATTAANFKGFENLILTNATAPSVNLGVSNVTYTNAAAGTMTGMTTGSTTATGPGTVNMQVGGTVALAATATTAAYAGTADSVTVNVGKATTTGALSATVTSSGVESATINNLAIGSDTTSVRTVSYTDASLKSLTVTGAQPTTITGGGAALTSINASGVTGAVTITGATLAAAGASITGGSGNDAITGSTGNDTLVGGAGNDAISGGAGVDSMTGGDGADTFTIAANTSILTVSTAALPDFITDFVAGTDKLSLAQTPSSLLGNFANIQQALAAAKANGVANSAAYITGENNLYVFTNTDGTLNVLDTVVKMPSTVTALTATDLSLGSQGSTGAATIALAAATVPVVNTTSSNATSSTVTTAFDDTITSAASTALVGAAAAINGGLGNDTLSATLATAGLLTKLDGGSATGVALTSIETVNLTVTASTAAVSLTTTLPTDLKTLTVAGTDGKQGLTASTSAIGQTITVSSTATTVAGGQASTITVLHANSKVTLGTTDDAVTIAADRNGSAINTGAGADTVTYGAGQVAFATAMPTTTTMTITGSTNDTGTVDTFAYAGQLAATENVSFKTYFDNGTLAGFEKISFTATNANDSAHTITLATGITNVLVDSDNGAENFTISATAAQANAITSIVDTTGTGVMTLSISDAGSVSLASDTTTNLDAISWADVAVALTLNNTAQTVTQTTGSATQSVVYGTLAAAQSVTFGSTGTVDFTIAGTDYGTNVGTGTVAFTAAAAAAATASLNFTGATATIDLRDANATLTNIDFVKFGAMTGSALILAADAAGAGSIASTINIASTGTNVSHEVNIDAIGTQTGTVTISGFTAGAVASGGDVINLNNATPGTTDITTVNAGILTTGVSTVTAGAALNAIVALHILAAPAFQISGALTQVGNGGAVAAAIIAAGLIGDASTDMVYFVLDNGTDTGIYRASVNASNGGTNTTTLIDAAADITNIVLVGVLSGVADANTLVAANFS